MMTDGNILLSIEVWWCVWFTDLGFPKVAYSKTICYWLNTPEKGLH
jgi:hypothetical protein